MTSTAAPPLSSVGNRDCSDEYSRELTAAARSYIVMIVKHNETSSLRDLLLPLLGAHRDLKADPYQDDVARGRGFLDRTSGLAPLVCSE